MCLSSYTVYFLAVGPSGCCSCCALVRPRPRGRKCLVVLFSAHPYVRTFFHHEYHFTCLDPLVRAPPTATRHRKSCTCSSFGRRSSTACQSVPSKLHTRNQNINRARLTPCVILPLFRWDPVAPSPLSPCPTPKPSFKSRTPLMVNASSPPLAACRAFLGSPGVRINTKL